MQLGGGQRGPLSNSPESCSLFSQSGHGYLKLSSTLHNLFCRTARVLAGSGGVSLELAREDARGPAEEVEWGEGSPFESSLGFQKIEGPDLV